MTVVWDDEFLSYDLGPEHPLNPVRLALTMSLSRQLGVLDRPNVTTVPPHPAGAIRRRASGTYERLTSPREPGRLPRERRRLR